MYFKRFYSTKYIYIYIYIYINILVSRSGNNTIIIVNRINVEKVNHVRIQID
jgi:hypothetical protein